MSARPVRYEVAAGPELTQWFRRGTCISVCVHKAVEVRESVFDIHRQRSVSANSPEKPKQKPNKKPAARTFFPFPGVAADIATNMGQSRIPPGRVTSDLANLLTTELLRVADDV